MTENRQNIFIAVLITLVMGLSLLLLLPAGESIPQRLGATNQKIISDLQGTKLTFLSGSTLQVDSGSTESHSNELVVAGTLRPSAGITNTYSGYQLLNTVARTDTTNKVIGVIPASATIADTVLYFTTASNAATTATVSCGKTSATPTEYVNAADVKAGATMQRGGASATMPLTNFGGVGASAVIVYCKYAETGTASTTGGPFTVILTYIR